MGLYIARVNKSVPKELRQWPQWVAWSWRWNRKAKKRDKVPINPKTGKQASVTDPATWGSFEEACEYASEHYLDGIGFVFTPDDPYCGVDLDDCIDPETGEVRLGVEDVLDSLDSYAEISPSGCGIKTIVRAIKPGDRYSTDNTLWGGKFELYDQKRFFAITGQVFREAPVRDAQEAIDDLYAEFFPEDKAKPLEELGTSSTGWTGDDEELLESARNCQKNGALFRKLYDHGNWEDYPSRSQADQALCDMLAWWTGCDHERVKRLFLGSKLTQAKYAEKGRYGEKYLDRTINKAISSCSGSYDPEYGHRMKAKVREVVSAYRASISEYGLREFDCAVFDDVLSLVESVGRYENNGINFDHNQTDAAKRLGIPDPETAGQRRVSRAMKRIREVGLLTRTFQGKKGKNSSYRLPIVSTTYVEEGDKKKEVSTTYSHSAPPVRIGSRHQRPRTPLPDVVIPFEDFSGKVYAPIVKQQREMVRNLPPISADAFYHHGPECSCWLCDEDAPEYIPAKRPTLTGAA